MSIAHAAGLATLAEIGQLAAARGLDLPLSRWVIGPGSVADLPAVLAALPSAPGRDVVVLADAVTYAGAGAGVEFKRQVTDALEGAGPNVRLVVLGNASARVHADDATLNSAIEQCSAAAQLVTVGSGTMADIGKVVALHHDLPHVVVQSAASVNGFADDQSVLLIDGAKRTTPTRWPEGLLIDLDVIAGAPIEMIRAGVGDLASMFTAPADWLLASALGLGAAYDAELMALVRPHGTRLLEVASRLDEGRPDDVDFLARLLTISGFTMGLAGATAPSSGLEHVISHLLEMRASVESLPPALHGEQVGIGVLVATAVWQRLRARVGDTLPALVVPDPSTRETDVRGAFAVLGSRTADECWSAYAKKLGLLRDHAAELDALRSDWTEFSRAVDGLVVPLGDLADALRKAGAPLRFSELASGFDADTVRWAVTHGHHMRDRFMVSDLVELLGWWDDDFVTDVLADLDRAGAGA